MARVNLGRWMRKQAVIPLIARLAEELGVGIRVEDAQGALLLATGPQAQAAPCVVQAVQRFPVRVRDEAVAWVVGVPRVATIAAFLEKLLEPESDKRDLVEETLSRYKEVTLLYDVVDRVTACLDTREVARIVIEEARRVIPLSSMAVLLCAPEPIPNPIPSLAPSLAPTPAHLLRCIGQFGPAMVDMSTGTVVGILREVWRTGRAQIVNDIHSNLRWIEGVEAVASLMCAPLKAKDRIAGVVLIGHATPIAYTSEDLKLFTTLATLAGGAIENASLYEQLHHAFDSTVYTLAETIEKRDPYTGNHTKRVVEYSLAIGKTLGLSAGDMRRLQMGAALHDVGKIGVRDSVLLKNAPLTAEEFEQIKRHPIYGEEIVANLPHLQPAMAGVVQHHERYNGTGYPRGLRGTDIDITARIIAVADAFDAMTSNRPYRDGLSLDAAFEELRKYSGAQFDPAVVDAFFASDVMDAFFTANARRKILTPSRAAASDSASSGGVVPPTVIQPLF
ncbi:HD domain-containing phosphohydrolase [Candidatus Symbiobacter mobilis]|nr:HD domain-containing phosphohydrolase [Candidatus Symbiobacter mobilis]